MTPASTGLRIKLLLLERGSTMTALADEIGETRSMTSQVAHGHLETPRVRRAIAGALGMTYVDLWGVDDPGVDLLPPGRKCLTGVNDFGEHADAGEVARG